MSEVDNRTAFFCRAKPQGVDALDVFLQNRGVYIGYPFVKKGMQYDPYNLANCLVRFDCDQEEWDREIQGQLHRQSKNRNRNFIPKVAIGSFVVIPRPSDACFYLGQVTSAFHIVNNPQGIETYLKRCAEQIPGSTEEKNQHRADVAMGWSVDEYRRFDLTRLPCWLRSSLQGRSTYGEFKNHPLNEARTAVAFFDDLWSGIRYPSWTWSNEPDEIKLRLVETLTVQSFEHLVVSLLQLEHPNEKWVQTGGAGDGGIDGLGSNASGRVSGIMQAKLVANTPPDLSDLKQDDRSIRRYGAVLILRKTPKKYAHELIEINWIADKVREHANRLPLALTLKVGAA